MLIFILIFFFVFISFCLKRNYLILLLITLELFVIIIYARINFIFINSLREIIFLLYYLIFRVIEGSLGLAILVYIYRTFGVDFIKSFNLSI
jgi:NADH:ubiquinone oxidoreductase subunit K